MICRSPGIGDQREVSSGMQIPFVVGNNFIFVFHCFHLVVMKVMLIIIHFFLFNI